MNDCLGCSGEFQAKKYKVKIITNKPCKEGFVWIEGVNDNSIQCIKVTDLQSKYNVYDNMQFIYQARPYMIRAKKLNSALWKYIDNFNNEITISDVNFRNRFIPKSKQAIALLNG